MGVTGDRGCCGHAHSQQAVPPTTVCSQTELALDTEPHSSTGFPVASVVKNPPANAGDVGLIPGLGRSPGERNGNLLQYSCLGNPMNRENWWVIVHGVAKESDTTEQLNNINRVGPVRTSWKL